MKEETTKLASLAAVLLIAVGVLSFTNIVSWTKLEWTAITFKPTCGDFESQSGTDYKVAYAAAVKSYLGGNLKLDGSRGHQGVPCEALKKKSDAQR